MDISQTGQDLQFWTRTKAYNYLLTELDREIIISHGLRRLLSDEENAGYLNLLRTKVLHMTPLLKEEKQIEQFLEQIDEIEKTYSHDLVGPKGMRDKARPKTIWSIFKELETIDIELRKITSNKLDFSKKIDPGLAALDL